MHTGVVSGVRLTFETADVETLETARVEAPLDALLAQPGVDEAFAIQTCNRVEAYVVARDRSTGRHALRNAGFDASGAVESGHEASLRHLMRVASGLESMVLGEDQVLGQMKDALHVAEQADAIGPMLREAVTKAVHVGERARTETEINEGVVSLGSAAARLAEREFRLEGVDALVVGAGEMGTLAAKALSTRAVGSLTIANRSRERAQFVANDLPLAVTGTDFADLAGQIRDADVVFSATASSGYVLDEDAFAENASETFVVDLAQPRDVAPEVASLADVHVRSLDDLKSVTHETKERRQAAARQVEDLIDHEFEVLLDQYKRKRADEVIAAMYESADRLKSRELEMALSKLDAQGDLNADQRATVAALADSLVSQLLAAPTKSLRDAAGEDDWATIATALQLFDPEFEGESPVESAGPPGVVETEDD